MSETKSLSLGGRTFEVPRFPLGVTIVVYRLCQKLTNAGLAERLADVGTPGAPPFDLDEAEIGDLTEIAFQCAHAADPSLDTEAFLALPVTPGELFAAFFLARIQCGGWRQISPEGGDAAGEGTGASPEPPPISTSTASSPASSATSTSPSSTG